jgi:hypothetical protein
LTAAPIITSLSPNSGPTAGLTTVLITGTGFTGTISVRFGSTATSYTIVSNTQISAIAPPGTGVAQVTVTSPAGVSNGVSYTYGVAAPTLTGLSPSSGPVTGGNTVTLTGTGLTGTTAVRFGSTSATSVTVVSAARVTAVAPSGTGTATVTATTPGGTSNGLSYTYASTGPNIVSLSPNSGPTGGSNTVLITGTGFSSATVVRFGSTATSFTVVSATQISVIAPAGTGVVQVTVTTPAGVSNGVSYTYLSVPTVTSVSPNTGPTAGGNTAAITGTGFVIGSTTVHFGPNAATSVVVTSPTSLTATVPAQPAP